MSLVSVKDVGANTSTRFRLRTFCIYLPIPNTRVVSLNSIRCARVFVVRTHYITICIFLANLGIVMYMYLWCSHGDGVVVVCVAGW